MSHRRLPPRSKARGWCPLPGADRLIPGSHASRLARPEKPGLDTVDPRFAEPWRDLDEQMEGPSLVRVDRGLRRVGFPRPSDVGLIEGKPRERLVEPGSQAF